MKISQLKNTTALALGLQLLLATTALAEPKQSIDIKAQPLAAAINELGVETGLRIAANADVLTGLTTQGVRGEMTPNQALQMLLQGTGLSVRSVGGNGVILSRTETAEEVDEALELDDGSFTLGTIIVPYDPGTGQPINPEDPNNTGQVTLDERAISYRSTGQDANTAIATLPNVQSRSDVGSELNRGGYSNGLPNDIGEQTDDVLNLKPLGLSISGAAVNENNIMIDGVGVNAVTSPTGLYTPEDGTNPQLIEFTGLHAQNQFVPTTFVEEAEVLDSNISAQYGGFLGGVVNYKLRQPDLEEARGSVSFSLQNDKMVNYSLATEDGENPQNRNRPEWSKATFAFDYSTPVSDRTAILFGYSSQRASTEKQRDIQYGSEVVGSNSRSDFYRFALTHELENGDELNARLNYTDYSQTWDIPESYNYALDIETKSLMADVEYSKELYEIGFLSNATLDLRFSAQRNKIQNKSGENQLFNWTGVDWVGNDRSASLDWCNPDASLGSVQNCFAGGHGDKEFQDDRFTLAADLTGNLGNGTFRTGIEYQRFNVNNMGTGLEQYPFATANASGTCLPGDPSCNAEQYFTFRILQDAYDIDVNAEQIGLYVEADQSFGDWTLRAGLRGDYSDVFSNFDLAPRLSATWTPTGNFALTMGANRYYDDNHLAYAVHDKTPGAQSQSRATALTDWFTVYNPGAYSYTSGDLKTPYSDELTLALSYQDSWTNGVWRLRGTKRKGKDLFAQADTSMLNPRENTLTNDGSSEYNSVTLEYQKSWDAPNVRFLDAVGLYTSLNWTDRQTSHNSYFEDRTALPQRIWYNGNGYNGGEWDAVTGNLDIPLRASVELRSSWNNDALRLGLIADLTAGYDGVIDSTSNYTNPADGLRYDIYEDHHFGSIMQLHLNSSVRLFTTDAGNEFRLDLRLNNLLDAHPNGTASDDNPYVRGRSLWIGGNMTF